MQTRVYLIDKNWLHDIWIGAVFGIIFIIINVLIPAIAIGFPSEAITASPTEKYVIVSLVAPIIEELLFVSLLLTVTSFLNKWWQFIINASIFSAFHYVAYGASLTAMSASFIGAALFAVYRVYIARKTDSILPSLITHSIFNTFLITSRFVIIGGLS